MHDPHDAPAPHPSGSAPRPWRLPLEVVLLAAATGLVLWSVAPDEAPPLVTTVVPGPTSLRSQLGAPTMLAPTGWRFEGRASPVALRAAAEAAGASWQPAEGGVALTLPADRLSELHLALETLGELHELDAPQPVEGTVTVRLELP